MNKVWSEQNKAVHIRQATVQDAGRIAEIEIFNYRINFYPIFKDDGFYFGEQQVLSVADKYASNENSLRDTYIYKVL